MAEKTYWAVVDWMEYWSDWGDAEVYTQIRVLSIHNTEKKADAKIKEIGGSNYVEKRQVKMIDGEISLDNLE